MTFKKEPLASDPLMQPFKTLENQKAELGTLKKSTFDEVWIRQTDAGIEIVPIDPEGFEAVSSKIEALTTKIEHNRVVLAKLQAECKRLDLEEYSLYRMSDRRNMIPREIQDVKREVDRELEHLFRAATVLGNRDAAEKHPMVIAARAKAAEKARPLEEEARDLDKKITSLEAILAEFKA
jgi:hypothetical protein